MISFWKGTYLAGAARRRYCTLKRATRKSPTMPYEVIYDEPIDGEEKVR